MRHVVPLFILSLCLMALPALAADEAPAAPAKPACVNMTPVDSYTPDMLPAESLDALFTPDPSQQAGCSAWAYCQPSGKVTCSGTFTCYGVDDCYAYCDGRYHWCSYLPHPCPI